MSRGQGQGGAVRVEDRARYLVLPVPTGGDLRVAGVRVRDRLLRALRLAGADGKLEHSAVPGGSRADEACTSAPVLAVAGDAVVDPAVLRSLLEAADAGAVALAAGDDELGPAALAFGAGAGPVPRDADGLGGAVRDAGREGRLRRVESAGYCRRARDASEARLVSKDLLAALPRPTDGFFARYFDRRLSVPMSVFFASRGLRPNTITLLATLVGLAGALLLVSSVFAWRVLGAGVIVFSTILDGCDGEVARLGLRASEAGRRLDLVGDNIVNAAVFAAIAGVALRQDTSELMPWVVATLLSGVIVAASTGFWFSAWIDRVGLGQRARAWYERMTSRDFVYLVFLLAVIDRLDWFLWLAAAGTWIFSFSLVVLRRVLIGRGMLADRAAAVGLGADSADEIP